MLILAGEAPCPRAAVLPPGALLPDVAGRLPAGAGPLLWGDGAELHQQVYDLRLMLKLFGPQRINVCILIQEPISCKIYYPAPTHPV